MRSRPLRFRSHSGRKRCDRCRWSVLFGLAYIDKFRDVRATMPWFTPCVGAEGDTRQQGCECSQRPGFPGIPGVKKTARECLQVRNVQVERMHQVVQLCPGSVIYRRSGRSDVCRFHQATPHHDLLADCEADSHRVFIPN